MSCLVIALSLLLAASAPTAPPNSGNERPLSVPARPIVGGTPDNGHPSVGALVARRHQCQPDQIGYVCTVTLIAPRVAITAAHCLDIYGPKGPYEVLFTNQVDSPAPKAALVLRTLAHPDYDSENHEWDLALLVLDREVDATPMEPVDRLLDATDIGQSVTAVGYGLTDPQELGTWGIKRKGDMVVTEVDLDSFETEPGPAMTCSGDSGGPVFLPNDQGERLAGVTASGDQACTAYAHNIQVAAAWPDFVQPLLDEVATEPVPNDEGTIPLDALCNRSCNADEDCPAHLACMPGLGGQSRCVLTGLIPSAFSETCSEDSDCEQGVCARLRPSGPDSCLCQIPCEQMKPPDGGLGDATLGDGSFQPDGGGDGAARGDAADEPGPGRGCACSAASRGASPASILWLFVVLGLEMLRRRRLRQRGRDS